MDFKVTSKLLIVKGHAQLPFPPVLKRGALNAHIQCHSLWFNENLNAGDEPFFVVCSGSTSFTQNNQIVRNVLGMFQNKKLSNIATFDFAIPLTTPQENLEIEIVDFHDKRQDLGAVAVFIFEGKVGNNLLA